jgi:hypothetical protein
MADIRCPMCGKPNLEELETCQFCGARLKPLVASSPDNSPSIHAGETPIVKATSEFEKVKLPDNGPIRPGEEPTPKNTEDLEGTLPSWLRTLREEGEQAPPESAADAFPAPELSPESQESQPAESAGESLDWLAGLGSAAEEEEQVPDWLAELRGPSGASASKPEQPPAPESELVQPEADWMSRLGSETAQVAAESQPQSAESLPDWFSRINGKPASAQPEEPLPFESSPDSLPEQPVAGNLPDWLETLKTKAAEPSELFTGEEEFPDWLSGMPPVPSETPSATQELQPDWLNKLKEKASEPELELPLPPAVPASDTPDWLSGLGAEAGARSAFETGSVFKDEGLVAGLAPAETPDWLKSLQSDENAAVEIEKHAEELEPEPELPVPEKLTEPLPDWLSNVQQADVPADSVPATTVLDESSVPVEETSAVSAVETPDWLSRLRPERSPVTQTPGPEEEPEDLEMAELPSWVQAMRPVEAVVSDAKSNAPEEGGEAENSGPLAGLRGVLPVGQEIGISRRPPAYSIKLQVTANQQKYAAQLEKMILDEGQAKGSKAVRLSSNRLWRWIISAVLIFVILIPLATGAQFTPDMKLFPSEWVNTKALLDAIPDGAPVLMVFDYDPALSGELQASAAPVVDRMLFLGARLTLISTTPTGPALAEQFLKFTQVYHLQTGMQYANLGYLPGGPAGVYYFANSPQVAAPLTVDGSLAWETSALQGVGRLSDFEMLVILTDNADTGRAWIEQTQSFIGDTPILMVISAQAEPMIRPYYDSGQIQGLVTGLVGGKTYEQSFGTNGLARQYWDSFGTGILAAVILIAIGGSVGATQAWHTRKKGEEA